MQHHGPGESSLHQTQLSTTAALLNQGVPIDEVVAQVLAATQKAVGAEGARWNWRHTERELRGMCETWIAKHPEIVAVTEDEDPEETEEEPDEEESPSPQAHTFEGQQGGCQPHRRQSLGHGQGRRHPARFPQLQAASRLHLRPDLRTLAGHQRERDHCADPAASPALASRCSTRAASRRRSAPLPGSIAINRSSRSPGRLGIQCWSATNWSPKAAGSSARRSRRSTSIDRPPWCMAIPARPNPGSTTSTRFIRRTPGTSFHGWRTGCSGQRKRSITLSSWAACRALVRIQCSNR